MNRLPARVRALLLSLVALCAGVTVTVVVADPDQDGRPDQATVIVERAAPQPAGDLAVPTPASPGATVAPPQSVLRDETPPAVRAPELDAGRAANERRDDRLPARPQPVGGAQNYSCRQDFSGNVYSSRRGQRPLSAKLHYTVSPNVPGWGDVRAVQGYFKRTRVGSSTFIVDFEKNCLQMVPLDAAPWTQGAFNRTSWSIEIIATGRETRQQWLASPLIRDGMLAALVRDTNQRLGLPLRWVDPVGCVDQLGITDHDLLECGNVHTDVKPAFPTDVFMRQVADRPRAISATARGQCQQLNRLRAAAAKAGGWARLGAGRHRLAVRRRDNLTRRGYVCAAGKDGRPGSVRRR